MAINEACETLIDWIARIALEVREKNCETTVAAVTFLGVTSDKIQRKQRKAIPQTLIYYIQIMLLVDYDQEILK